MMTEPTPEDLTADRLGGDLHLTPAYQPPGFYGPRTGPGRWFTLDGPTGPLGVVWTNDRDGLGFLETTDAGRVAATGLVVGFQHAAAVGSTPTRVFDHLAGQVTLTRMPGQITEGDLATLDDLA